MRRYTSYKENSCLEKEALTKETLFTSLLQNVRFSVSGVSTLKDVTYLMKIANGGYMIAYSECTDVISFVEELLKNEQSNE